VKGHAGLLRAATSILHAEPDAHFVVVGDGPLGSQLLTLALQLGVDQAFHFVGPRSDVYDVMSAMDIFVLPSLSEGIPMALLEAMALGKPVVAAAVGGVPEVIQHRVNGLLVESGDDRALADACLELTNNPQWAAALGDQAARTIAERFSRDRSGEALLLAYRGIALVANGRAGGRPWMDAPTPARSRR
jgi:glycosyltransferase involved in cell wall biosynthesis